MRKRRATTGQGRPQGRGRGWRNRSILALALIVGAIVTTSLSIGARPVASAPFGRVQPGMIAPDARLVAALDGAVHLMRDRGHPVLLSFLQTQPDTAVTSSKGQQVFLSSMARQYGPRGVQVMLVDASLVATGRQSDRDSLINTTYDWNLGRLPLLNDPGGTVARRYGVRRTPTTFLIGSDGRVAQRWNGFVPAARLAFALQAMVDGPALPALHSARPGLPAGQHRGRDDSIFSLSQRGGIHTHVWEKVRMTSR